MSAYAEYTTRTAENTAATADEHVIKAFDFKQAPPGEGPDDAGDADENTGNRHPEFPEHKPNGEWAGGNSGVEGEVEAHEALDERETKRGFRSNGRNSGSIWWTPKPARRCPGNMRV